MTPIEKIPETAMDVFEMLPEHTRCQVIGNVLYMSPAPTQKHERVRMNITFELETRIRSLKAGYHVYSTAPNVHFPHIEGAFIPDIIIILKENLHIIKKGRIYGAPDII